MPDACRTFFRFSELLDATQQATGFFYSALAGFAEILACIIAVSCVLIQ